MTGNQEGLVAVRGVMYGALIGAVIWAGCLAFFFYVILEVTR